MIEKETLGRRQQAIEQFRRSAQSPQLFSITEQISNYWFNLKKTGLLPDRNAINPRNLRSILPQIIMLERDETGHFTVRLSGTGITELWGFEPTGRRFLAQAAPQSRNKVRELLDAAAQHPCGVIIRSDDLYTDGRSLQSELSLFPVRMGTGQTTILFGALAVAEQEDQGWPQPILATAFYRIENFRFINIGGGTSPTPSDDG